MEQHEADKTIPDLNDQQHPGLQDLLYLALLLGTTLAVYWQVGGFEFLSWDDTLYVSENWRVRQGLHWDNVVWATTAMEASNWHPLTWLSHMLDVSLFGLDAGAHHLVNLALHLVNSSLVYALLRHLPAAAWRAALVAALFALHPLHVESVAWLSERKDLLSTLFWLVAIGAYLRYALVPCLSRYLVVTLLFVLGLAAKPMVVTLPLVFLLLDFWPLQRIDRLRIAALWPLLREKLPWFVLSLLAGLLTLVAQQQAGSVASVEVVPLIDRLLNASMAYGLYLWRILVPLDLAFFYPYDQQLGLMKPLLVLVLLVWVTLFTVRHYRRAPHLVIGWLWFLLTLLPVIGLIQVGKQSMADRYTYIPLIGIFAMVAYSLPDRLATSWPGRLSVCAALLLLSILSWQQAGSWKASETLYLHALEHTRGNYLAHANLAILYEQQGKLAESQTHAQLALAHNPNDLEARIALGNIAHRQGRAGEAADWYRQVLSLHPQHALALYNLGTLALEARDPGQARELLEASLAQDSRRADTWGNLAVVLMLQGDYAAARDHLQAALLRDPTNLGTRYNLGRALERLGQTAAARRAYLQLLELDPNHVAAQRRLARLANPPTSSE